VRDGRVVVLPGAWLERPGPRLVDALEALVEKLRELGP
jgi:ABC-type Fe3+-hydroxamate transport system substrate-binding protein